MINLFEAFRRHRNERPNEPAFLIPAGDRSLPISWRQFTDDIAVISWLIKVNSVKTIALLGENSYDWMVSHAACLFSGIVVVPIDVNVSAEEIAERLRKVDADFLVYSSLFHEKAEKVSSLLPRLKSGSFGSRKTEIYLNAGRVAIKAGFKTIWHLPCKIKPGQTSMIVFTSGTTSSPQGAELTVAGIEAFVESATLALKIKEGDTSLMVLPLYHIYGICVAYSLLANGAYPGVCPDFRRLYDAVERFNVDYLFLVPALVDILAVKIERRGKSAEEALGRPLKWILSGGAPLPRRTYERMKALGVEVLSAYGLTESTALFSIDPCDRKPAAGSSGLRTMLSSCETEVSEEGELLIRGPSVMKGYLNAPEKTAKSIDKNGWLHTGDYGRIDEEGNVYVVGRISRTIILSTGKKISPEEIEESLMSLPDVLEVFVAGDAQTREITAEIYTLSSEEKVRKAIDEFNFSQPVYKRIDSVKIRRVPFERTSSGKVRVAR